jgi:hypothetical protein
VAADPRIDASDRSNLAFLLEVAGLDADGASVSWWMRR